MATNCPDSTSRARKSRRIRAASLKRLAVVLFTTISVAGTALAQQAVEKGPRNLRPEEVAVPVDEASLQLQYSTLAAMGLTEIEYNENNLVRYAKGRTGLKLANHRTLKPGDVAGDLATQLEPMLLTTGTETLTVQRNTPIEELGVRNVQLTQSIANFPVMAGILSITVDEDTGEILQLSSSVVPNRGLPRKPKITAEKAKQLAASHLVDTGWAETKSVVVSGEPRLAYFAGTSEARKPALVWAMSVDFLTADQPPPTRPGGMPVTWQVCIDAIDGTYLGQLGVTHDAPRAVYSADNVAETHRQLH